jgi:hypothetical protein
MHFKSFGQCDDFVSQSPTTARMSTIRCVPSAKFAQWPSLCRVPVARPSGGSRSASRCDMRSLRRYRPHCLDVGPLRAGAARLA